MNPDFVDLLRAFIAADVRFLTAADFSEPGPVFQIGVAPGRIDILTTLTGLTFEQAWADRIERPFGEIPEVSFIGKSSFILNKRATGRTKDLADIEGLE